MPILICGIYRAGIDLISLNNEVLLNPEKGEK